MDTAVEPEGSEELPPRKPINLGELQEEMIKLQAVTIAHRRKLIEAGFDEGVADEMAQTLHDYLLGDFLG